MKPTIKYNVEHDFLLYTKTCANIKDMRHLLTSEFKSHPILKNKKLKKKTDDFFNEAEKYYTETLSFVQRNEANMFFNKVSIFSCYLSDLALNDKKLENESIDNFKTFVVKVLELKDTDFKEDELLVAIKAHYENPNSFDDYNKTAELILEIIKDESMFDFYFKNIVSSLRKLFIDEKYEPSKEVFMKKLSEHNEIYKKDPREFFDHLSAGVIKQDDFNLTDFQPFISFFAPLYLSINTSSKSIVYGADLEYIVESEIEYNLVEALLKFLSDPKRYKMIQMLSKGKWYANELAKEFKITPATMSYHVNKLYQIGLISFEQGEQNKMYIELDNKRLESLLDIMKKDLTN